MTDDMNPQPRERAASTAQVWDYAGLSSAVADDLSNHFGAEPRAVPRNETMLFSHPVAERARARRGSPVGLAARVGVVLAAGAVGLAASWMLTHPPVAPPSQAQTVASPAEPTAAGLAVQVEGAPGR